ncbi:MAG: Sir2 family NAD-dependent protein deacetylase [Anaeromyxobacteraceae bacterium]
MTTSAAISAAALALREAEVLLVGAGAGIGVDSGLPDFRGDQGFWNAYPPYEKLGLTFVDAANPEHFGDDPAFGWGFYGHRLGLYRATVPHAGFALLRRWAEARGLASFVFTSNVDGQFQKAGFDPARVAEVHGSIHHLQCAGPCTEAIWENREEVPVDLATMRARAIPRCPRCRGVARPNILMFGDFGWIPDRSTKQGEAFDAFLEEHRGRRTVIIELGAGKAIPSVRVKAERLAQRPGVVLVRINPREADGPKGTISIPAGALEGLGAIQAELDAG